MLKAEKVQEKEKKGSISAFIAFNYLLGVGSNKRDVKGGCCWLFDCLLQLSKAKKEKKSTKRNKRASKGESLFPDEDNVEDLEPDFDDVVGLTKESSFENANI